MSGGVITYGHYLALSAVLFFIGAAGVVTRRNLIVIFMSIEIMLNAANLAFVASAFRWGSMDGQTIVFFVMAVAAAEAAIGLAVIIALFRSTEAVKSDEVSLLRW